MGLYVVLGQSLLNDYHANAPQILYIRWSGVHRIGEEERRVTSLPTGSAETQFGSVCIYFDISLNDPGIVTDVDLVMNFTIEVSRLSMD